MAMAPPPGPPEGASASRRCAWCHGGLYDTKATGQPQRADHGPDCKYLAIALQVMRYATTMQAAAELRGQGLFNTDRQRQRYWRKGAKALSAAACTGNPVRAVTNLAERYSAECQAGTKQTKDAEVLADACLALAQGEDPAPLNPPS